MSRGLGNGGLNVFDVESRMTGEGSSSVKAGGAGCGFLGVDNKVDICVEGTLPLPEAEGRLVDLGRCVSAGFGELSMDVVLNSAFGTLNNDPFLFF